MANLYVDVISDWHDWLALEPIWNSLVAKSKHPSIYSSFEFLTLSWKHFHSKNSNIHIILIKDRLTQEIIGIAPFRIQAFTWFRVNFNACEYITTAEVDKPTIISRITFQPTCSAFQARCQKLGWYSVKRVFSTNSLWILFDC